VGLAYRSSSHKGSWQAFADLFSPRDWIPVYLASWNFKAPFSG